jgi:hypothetical protein
MGLSAMRGEVAAFIAASQALAQQAKSTETSLVESAQAALCAASLASRNSVTGFMHDYYDQRIFDRYLRFNSAEDEAEYRRREEERKRDIEKAMAERTPQGDLRANQLAIDQLKDAGVHGADRSPQYKAKLDQLERSNHELAKAFAGSQDKAVAENAAASLDPDAQQASPPAKVSPEVISQLRSAQVSPATTPLGTCNALPPITTGGSARCR